MSNSPSITILIDPPVIFLLVAPPTGIAAMSAQLQTATAQRDLYIAEQASDMVHKLSEKGKKHCILNTCRRVLVCGVKRNTDYWNS